MDAADSTKSQLDQGFSLDAYVVHPTLNRVDGPSGPVRLEPRIMAVLMCLARRAGAVVPRQDLFLEVWGPSGATDDVLSRSISEIRKALGETSKTARLVETIPKSGYRLTVVPRLLETPIPTLSHGAQPPGPSSTDNSTDNSTDDSTRGNSPTRRFRRSKIAGVAAAAVAAIAVFALASRAQLPAAEAALSAGFSRAPVPFSALDGDEIHPTLSPDGERVVFGWRAPDGRFDLIEQPLDAGSASTPLTQTHDAHEVSPAWAPDGRHLAYLRIEAQGCSIVVRTVDSGAESVIHRCAADQFSRIRWSPTGNFVALTGRPGAGDPSRLYRLDLDPADPTKTPPRGPLAVTTPPPQSAGDDAFAISPKGDAIVLTRLAAEGVADLFRLDLTTGSVVRLTERTHPIYDVLWPSEEWVWASTAWDSQLGLWRLPAAGGEPELLANTQSELYDLTGGPAQQALVFRQSVSDVDLIRLPLAGDGVEEAPLIGTTRADSKPALSSDGTRLVFESNRSGPYEIWVSDTAGSEAVQLTRLGGAYNGHPRWAPSGGAIVFEGRPTGQADIYVVDPEGASVEQITSDPGQDVTPSWSHDGGRIYWSSDRTGQWEVWSRAVGGDVDEQVTTRGGLSPQLAHDGSALYYAKPFEDGIWRRSLPLRDDQPEERVLEGVAVGDYSAWWLIAGGVVYQQRDASGGAQLVRFDARANTSTELFPVTPTPLYSGGLTVSPDGTYAIVATPTRQESDLAVFRAGR